MERKWKSQFNQMRIRMEQWIQKIKDRIRGKSQPQFKHTKVNIRKQDETEKLDKPTASQTQPKNGHVEKQIIEPGSMRHEECINKLDVVPECKAELQKMKAQIRGMRNNVCKRVKNWKRIDIIEPPFTDEIMEMS